MPAPQPSLTSRRSLERTRDTGGSRRTVLVALVANAVVAARALEALDPGHVIVAGDFDADPAAASVRFWTGREALDGLSVCYRDAWEACRPGEPGHTFAPENPNAADWDWPFRRIDYILVRCGEHGGPTLAITACARTFDGPDTSVSDHYGLVADLEAPGR